VRPRFVEKAPGGRRASGPSVVAISGGGSRRPRGAPPGKRGTYRTDGRATSWLKIKNPNYTQLRDRHELFAARQGDARRGRAPPRPDLVLR
jgi:hypothetical protein